MDRYVSAEAGFTLIELMVAMTLSLMVVGGSMAAFRTQQVAFDRQQAMGEADDNVRFGLDTMAHEVRAAGYLTQQDVDLYLLTPNDNNAVAGDGIIDGSDALILRYAVGDQPAQEIVPGTLQIADLDLDNDGTDDLDPVAINPADSTTWVPVVVATGYRNGWAESLMVSAVGGVAGAYQVSVRKVANDVGNDALPDRAYGGGVAHLAVLREVVYYLGDGATPPSEAAPTLPQLMRRENGGTPEVIGEGVTTLQLTYSVAGSAAFVSQVAPANLAAGEVTAVRIQLGGKSLTQQRDDNPYQIAFSNIVGVRNAL